MKKLLLLLIGIATILSTGCSKNDNEEHGSAELVGTRWIYEEGSVFSYFWQEDVTFTSINQVKYHYMELSNFVTTDEGETTGSYTYNPPTVTGSISMDGVTVSLRGEVNGSTMAVYLDGKFYANYKLEKK